MSLANGAATDSPTPSEEPRTRTASDWPGVPTDSPAEARWRAHMEGAVDSHTTDLDEIKRDLRRVADHVTRGGPFVRGATALGSGLLVFGTAALGDKGKNVPFLAVALVALVALAYVGSVTLEGFGVTLSTANGTAASGPAPQPATLQE